MIEVDKVKVSNFEGAFRGLRNPMNSWEKSDSFFGIIDLDDGAQLEDLIDRVVASYEPSVECWQIFYDEISRNGTSEMLGRDLSLQNCVFIGASDYRLAEKMALAGTDESKFMRQIMVSMDIDAPLYWWKEFDTYKVGTVANSCSTMHKITSTPITKDCFSFDTISLHSEIEAFINSTIEICEYLRKQYIETKNKAYWRALIQILPESWMQKRTVTLNYQVLRSMYFARRNHKLIEWQVFCEAIKTLPYSGLITVEKNEDENIKKDN